MTLVPGESAADRWSLIMDHGFNPACGCCLVFSQGGFYWFGVCLTWLLDIQKAHPFCLWHHLLLSLSFLSLLITPVGGPISNLSISYSFRSIEYHLIVSNSRASVRPLKIELAGGLIIYIILWISPQRDFFFHWQEVA